MNLLFRNNMILIALLSFLLILFVNQNAFCDEEPPEDPLQERVERILFSPCNLTNVFYGILESSPDISEPWIHVLPQGTNENFIVIYADSTNILQSVRSQSICSFQLGSTNENCHVSFNLTLTCLWDETADDRGEDEYLVTYCKKLSFEDEVSGTILPTFNDTVHDSDVYYFESNGKSGFCFEMDSADELDYKVSFDDGDWENINKIQMLNKHGNEIPKNYRLYVTNELTGVQYSFVKIKRESGSSNDELSYKIKLRKARPLILVHGIEAFPTNEASTYILQDEKKNSKTKIAFYYIYKSISAWNDFCPAIPFPFPWNSKIGSYESFCIGSSSLKSFCQRKNGTWYLGPVIMAHSMGGLLSVKQMEADASFANNVEGLVCLGSPFCGSDIGNSANLYSLVFGGVHNTSSQNIEHLSRGTSYVLNRIRFFPNAVHNLRHKDFLYGVIKDNNNFYRFCKYTGEGDGIVNCCSANVGETLHWEDCKGKEIQLNHIELDDMKLEHGIKNYTIIYNSLKDLIKQ